MKKILLILLSNFLFCVPVFAALNGSTVWEVRTTGASTNGGGFNATRDAVNGVDYSQQDAAQLSLTDLAMTSASTTLTSATGGFTHAMEGNIIYIASGTNFVAGYYEIVTYTNTNTVTLDRTAVSGGNGSSGSGKVGGAVDHPSRIQDAVVSGNTVYIAGGTYTGATWTPSYSAGNGVHTFHIGYVSGTSRTEAYGTDRPLFDAENTLANGIYVTGSRLVFKNLRVSRATDDGVNESSGTYNCAWINCSFYNNGAAGIDGGNSSQAFACDAYGNTTYGFESVTCRHCYAHDNTSVGFTAGAHYCISESNASHGFQHEYGAIITGCVAYGNTGASTDGFYAGSNSNSTTMIWNNVAVSNGRYGFNKGASTAQIWAFFDYNAYYGNGTAGINTTNLSAGAHDISSNPSFTDPTANPPDFTLQSGSSLISVGFPDADWSTRVGLATASYKTNIGVDQDDNASGGGGGAVITTGVGIGMIY